MRERSWLLPGTARGYAAATFIPSTAGPRAARSGSARAEMRSGDADLESLAQVPTPIPSTASPRWSSAAGWQHWQLRVACAVQEEPLASCSGSSCMQRVWNCPGPGCGLSSHRCVSLS